jgi:hypothetical protein
MYFDSCRQVMGEGAPGWAGGTGSLAQLASSCRACSEGAGLGGVQAQALLRVPWTLVPRALDPGPLMSPGQARLPPRDGP